MDLHNFGKPEPNPHQNEKQDPLPVKVRSWIPDPDPYLSLNSRAVKAKNGATKGQTQSLKWSHGRSVDK
jgi:hypothetical protein